MKINKKYKRGSMDLQKFGQKWPKIAGGDVGLTNKGLKQRLKYKGGERGPPQNRSKTL